MAGNEQQQQPKAPRVKECSTCQYWDNSIGSRNPHPTGLCRRNAPMPSQIITTMQEHAATGIMMAGAVWPVTLAGENCGEHKFPANQARE